MQKDFDRWNELKKEIDGLQPYPFGYVHEREIWWCSIGVNVGDEEDGKNSKFERPVLVLKKFNRHIVMTVPMTTQVKNNPYYYLFTHDNIQFAAILSQTRILSTKRFSRRIRIINDNLFDDVRKAVIEASFTTNDPRLLGGVSGA